MTRTLRVASYNLHKGRGMVGPHAPERNLQVIADLDAHVIALQEVDFRMGTRPEALPRALIRVDSLPRTGNDKIDRARLRSLAAAVRPEEEH